jgi:CO/xanthine dehydrogenase Mo-binding subunit
MFGFGGPHEPSPLKGCKPEEMDMIGGRVVLKADPSKGVLSRRPLRRTYRHLLGRPPAAIWSLGMGRMLDTMNTAWCEVAVDEETGEVEILKLGVVADPGKVMRLRLLKAR